MSNAALARVLRSIERRMRLLRTFPVGVLAKHEWQRFAWIKEVCNDVGCSEHVLVWTQRGQQGDVEAWFA